LAINHRITAQGDVMSWSNFASRGRYVQHSNEYRKPSVVDCGNRVGFTIVELLVVIGIVSILVGLLLPAVQYARESVRRADCQNRLKNLSLAAINLESAERHLPGAFFDHHPDESEYIADRGLFVSMLPYMEETSLFNRFDQAVPSSSPNNRQVLLLRPALLACPSTGESARLSNMAAKFSGTSVPDLTGMACDYVGNDGAYIDRKPSFGAVRVRVGGLVRERRLREITDGLSNTLLFWESAGDKLHFADRRKAADMDTEATANFGFMIDAENRRTLYSNTQASTKSYLYAWTGLRIGGMAGYDTSGQISFPSEGRTGLRVVNIANDIGQPFSMHAGGCNFSHVDGSVKFISQSVTELVLMSKATASAGDRAGDSDE
jgi:prepilin-type processing-associated H-X9-DG protein